jgi:thioredoxin 1
MEPELEKVQNSVKPKINVTILNIMNPNSQNVMKYFGISAVPTQIILDRNGKEIFRNYGFIAAEDLLQKTQS